MANLLRTLAGCAALAALFCSTAAVVLSAARVAGVGYPEGERPRLSSATAFGAAKPRRSLQHLPAGYVTVTVRYASLPLCGRHCPRSFKVMAPEAVQRAACALHIRRRAQVRWCGAPGWRGAGAPRSQATRREASVCTWPWGCWILSEIRRREGDGVRLPAVSDTENELTVAFWLFLRNSPISRNFLVRKGDESVQFTPTIQISKTRQLHVRLREIVTPTPTGTIESFARVPWRSGRTSLSSCRGKWRRSTLTVCGTTSSS